LSDKQILQAFKALDLPITPEQSELLIMYLYQYTGDLKKLDYMKMFEAFKNEEYRRIRQINEKFQQQEEESESEEEAQQDQSI